MEIYISEDGMKWLIYQGWETFGEDDQGIYVLYDDAFESWLLQNEMEFQWDSFSIFPTNENASWDGVFIGTEY